MSRAERTAAAREAITKAVADGFMDCKTIVRALYPERFPDRPVRWDAAYRWMREVGVEVYIAPDGDTDVPKAERTGCWGADFPKVLARKTAYYQQIALNDWTRNVEGAEGAGLSREEAEEMMGPSPPRPAFFVDTAAKAGGTKPPDQPMAPPGDKTNRLRGAGGSDSIASSTRCGPGPGRATRRASRRSGHSPRRSGSR